MLDLRNCDNMELMAEFEDNHFDLAIVDPPYGIGEDGAKNHTRDKAAKATRYIAKNWDNNPPQTEYFKELKRVSKNQIIWGANHFIENIPNANSSCWIVWDKDNTGDFADSELAWTSFKSAVRNFKHRWNGMLQENMKNKEHRIHPTQKPKALYKWLLQKYAKEGDKILDTHLGSGSIAIACHEMGFDLVGCELDTEYYNAMVERIEIETRQQDLFA
jgi:site-specific DNA-methyltransferase (adenine-specific)